MRGIAIVYMGTVVQQWYTWFNRGIHGYSSCTQGYSGGIVEGYCSSIQAYSNRTQLDNNSNEEYSCVYRGTAVVYRGRTVLTTKARTRAGYGDHSRNYPQDFAAVST